MITYFPIILYYNLLFIYNPVDELLLLMSFRSSSFLFLLILTHIPFLPSLLASCAGLLPLYLSIPLHAVRFSSALSLTETPQHD